MAVTTSPKPVVQVRDVKLYAQLSPQLHHDVQQAYGIRSAGDPDNDSAALADQVVLPDELQDPSRQRTTAGHVLSPLRWQVSFIETSTVRDGLKSSVHMEARSNRILLHSEMRWPRTLQSVVRQGVPTSHLLFQMS